MLMIIIEIVMIIVVIVNQFSKNKRQKNKKCSSMISKQYIPYIEPELHQSGIHECDTFDNSGQ